MTVRDAARLLGRSTSTIYRWLRKGHLAPFEQAGLAARRQGRRWVIDRKFEIPEIYRKKEPSMEWPPQVHEATARQDGLAPEQLQFEQWPVSNVRMRHIDVNQGEYFPPEIAAVYACDIPADTPQPNRYDADNNPLPDPVGMALSWVKFQLCDADTGQVLDEDLRDHTDGQVLGFLGDRCALWNRLMPSQTVRVRLVAFPYYFYLGEDGAALMQYTTNSDGYFHGVEVASGPYTLSIDWDGNLFIDGEGRPEPAAPPVELPADWQEGQSFGQYIKAKREAAGLSQEYLGATLSQPWKNKEGGETYYSELWMQWIEDDRAALRLEWNGEIVLNSNQIYGLADALGIDGQHLTNLAEQLV